MSIAAQRAAHAGHMAAASIRGPPAYFSSLARVRGEWQTRFSLTSALRCSRARTNPFRVPGGFGQERARRPDKDEKARTMICSRSGIQLTCLCCRGQGRLQISRRRWAARCGPSARASEWAGAAGDHGAERSRDAGRASSGIDISAQSARTLSAPRRLCTPSTDCSASSTRPDRWSWRVPSAEYALQTLAGVPHLERPVTANVKVSPSPFPRISSGAAG